MQTLGRFLPLPRAIISAPPPTSLECSSAGTSKFGRRMLAQAFAVTQMFERLPIPTVVAVRGRCLAAAVS